MDVPDPELFLDQRLPRGIPPPGPDQHLSTVFGRGRQTRTARLEPTHLGGRHFREGIRRTGLATDNGRRSGMYSTF